MLNKTTAAPQIRRPWRWYRVGAPEEHLSGSVLLRSSTRVGAPEEPGSVLLRSWLLRSRVGDSQERPSPTYQMLKCGANVLAWIRPWYRCAHSSWYHVRGALANSKLRGLRGPWLPAGVCSPRL